MGARKQGQEGAVATCPPLDMLKSVLLQKIAQFIADKINLKPPRMHQDEPF